MNILLAGGAGYIGSHTAVELLTAEHDVVIVDNYCNSCAEAVNRVEEVSGKKVVSYEADVKDKVAMAKRIRLTVLFISQVLKQLVSLFRNQSNITEIILIQPLLY
jgi:UDP-glucose 4-epimerase